MFNLVCYVGIAIVSMALIISLALAVRSQDPGTRAILSDMVFYSMLGVYFIWTLMNDTSIVYDVAILASILGLLTTVSLARILSKGRR